MAFAKVYMKNSRTGQMREAPVGFSWTVFFFGFLPALFRKDWFGFLILLVIAVLTCGISNLIFMFIYNKMYLKSLIKDGYEATSASADLAWVQQKTGVQIPSVRAAA